MHTDLWDFAVDLYAQPGVEAACLALQSGGADVCLLLCGAWLDRRGSTLNDEHVEALVHLSGDWQRDIVQPLRSIRQQWREQAASDAPLATLRERLKRLELDAERLQLERLEAFCGDWPRGSRAQSENWLSRLTPATLRHHDALQVLRAATLDTQEAEVGD